MKKLLPLILFCFLGLSAFSQTEVLMPSNQTSGTITCPSTQQHFIIIHDAGLTTLLSISFPPNPFNGQKVTICSSGGMVGLTLTSVVGAITNAITSIAAGGNATYVYVLSTNKWYKIR